MKLLIFTLKTHAYIYLSADEEDLLQGLNSFRQTATAPPLTKHDKADCVADEIADKLDGKSCASNTATSVQAQLMSDYPSVLKKCNVDVNTTTDGMILPVCVPHRVATLVLTNYTQSQNAKYLNDSKFTGAGVGTEDDWTVVVLTTAARGGSFASGARRFLAADLGYSRVVPIVLFVVFLVFV